MLQKLLSLFSREKRSLNSEVQKCDLAVVVDTTFFNDIGQKDVNRTLRLIFWLIKESNFLLQSANFFGKSVGIELSAVSILTADSSDKSILSGMNYSTPEDFLKQFSRYNFSKHCLAALFTNRIFADLVLGLSWRGNPVPGGVGGICQSLSKYKVDSKIYSFNCLFVSMSSQQQPRIPLRMAVLNLFHEVMHSFGAKHDPEATDEPNCTPKDQNINGRFLMSRFSNNGRKMNHQLLSLCSRKSVAEVLKSKERTHCLR